MRTRSLSRIGASSGIFSVVITFVGFGVHGGLPSAATADAVRSYVDGVSSSQTGIGNYIELLGYVLFLVFAAFLYAVACAANPDRRNWLALVLAAAGAYVAVSTVAIAGQQVMVEWSKAGADSKTVLGIFILDDDAFTLSFELAALFLAALGAAFLHAGRALSLMGVAAIVIAVIVFVSGLIGTASIENGISQVGFILFMLWTLAASIYLLIRPPLSVRPESP
ncbi:MAG TPA: hypothetical protein VIP78_16055 [Candidatus Dormibacteraeota bacterium]